MTKRFEKLTEEEKANAPKETSEYPQLVFVPDAWDKCTEEVKKAVYDMLAKNLWEIKLEIAEEQDGE